MPKLINVDVTYITIHSAATARGFKTVENDDDEVGMLRFGFCTFEKRGRVALFNVLSEEAPTELHFVTCNIKDDADFCRRLVDLLKVNQSITTLRISDCDLSDEAARKLLDIFYLNSSIQAIILQNNKNILPSTMTMFDKHNQQLSVTKEVASYLGHQNDVASIVTSYLGLFAENKSEPVSESVKKEEDPIDDDTIVVGRPPAKSFFSTILSIC